MKKTFFLLCCMAILLISCSNQDSIIFNNGAYTEQLISSTSERIIELNSQGTFDEIHKLKSLSGFSDSRDSGGIEVDKLKKFVMEPESVLVDIAKEENGIKQIELMSLILNEGTVDDVIKKMEEIDPEMALNYEEALIDFIDSTESNTGRSFGSTGIFSVRDIQLQIAPLEFSRGPFAHNLNWDTIHWYTGFAATTIAGLSAYRFCSWWQPWVGVAGLVTAGAGAAAMTTQLGIWYAGVPEVQNFVSKIFEKDSHEVTKLSLQNPFGEKVLSISAATGGVVGFACIGTPEVAGWLVSGIKSTWNSFINYITPDGFTFVVQGVELRPL